ncbi:MAG: CPBP family intramembrane metalloprotease [Bacteroidetes bacterium]|nr:CPBP family intramembrane metalloprotease [Bacteroidota bacterium]
MKGFMKTKPAGNQFLILVGVVLVSCFVIGMIGTLALSAITGISLESMTDLSSLDYSKPAVINFLRGMQLVQFISLFVVPVFICLRLFSTEDKKYMGWKNPSHPGYIMAGIGVMLIALPFTSWLGEINRNIPFPSGIESWMKEQEEDAAKTIQALLSRHTVKDLLLNIVFVAGLAAVGEELLFRGMAQRLLIKMFKSPWAGILISAAIFSAMHMQFYGFLPRFALGVLLGIIYWYSGSLWVAMLAHFIYDVVLIVVAYFNPEMLADENNMQLSNLALAGTLSLALVLPLVIWMQRKSATTFNAVYADDEEPAKNHPFDFKENTPE